MSYLGTEQVTNGDFTYSAAGWTVTPSSWVMTSKVALLTQNKTGAFYQNLSTRAGKTYRVTFDAVLSGGAAATGSLSGSAVAVGNGANSLNIVAGSSTQRIMFSAATAVGQTVIIDNISIQEILDYYVYRGQDGVIDYNTPVDTMLEADTEVAIAAQDLPANTIWHYVRKQIRDCGLESEASDPCIIMIDASGDSEPDAPNTPQALTAETIAGGKVMLRWRYSPEGQAAPPHGFAVYQVQVKPFGATPAGIVFGGVSPRNEFAWYSEILADGMWLFKVVAYNNSGGLSQGAVVSAVVDSTGPDAIQTLLAETA